MSTLLDLNQEELFELLGKELTAHQAFPLSKEELIERGRNWFNAHIEPLRLAICSNPNTRFLIEDSDAKTALIAIADLIAKISVGVAPVTVAALLLKVGIKKLCSGELAGA